MTDYNFDLEMCTSIPELDKYLIGNGIADDGEAINYLCDYMGITEKRAFSDPPTAAEECVMLKKMFIAGRWREMSGKYRSRG